jgi:diguanylate cyclase (GGDEF)-like protein/PAS domain S-box-containing protein
LARAITWGAPVLLAVTLVLIAARQEGEYRRDYARSQVRNLSLLLSEDLGSRLRDIDDELRAEAVARTRASPGQPLSTGPGQLQGPLKNEQGQWVVRVSRAASAQGEPMVSRDVPVAELGAALQKIELGPHGAATIRTLDMRLVYRHPLPPGGLSRIGDAKISSELQEAVAAQPAQGEFVARTVLDGISRVNAYRRLEGYPLMVIVGVAEADFPDGWGRVDRPLFTLALITLLTLAGAIWAVQRASRRALSNVQSRHDLIVAHSNDAIVSTDLAGTVQTWNTAAERILGWSAQDIVGRRIHELIPVEWTAQETAQLERLAQGEAVETLETERLHKGGHRVPMAITMSPVRDADGHIIGASTIARDISRQKAMEQTIRDMAYRDPLTGLPNRRQALEELARAQARSRRTGQWHGLVFIDVDGLKAINDRHGHHEGDRYLIDMGRRVQEALRETDHVARIGGDEFVALCLDLGATEGEAQGAVSVIEAKLRQALSQPWPLSDAQGPVLSGASLGSALFDGQDEPAERIVQRADARMYADKQARKVA